jgi:general stress protein YciG
MPEEETTHEELSEAGRKGAQKRWGEGGGNATPEEREALRDVGQKGGQARGRERRMEGGESGEKNY